MMINTIFFKGTGMLLFLFTAGTIHAQNHQLPVNSKQVSFTENSGQISDQYSHPRPDVLFSGTSGNLSFHLKKSGISYQLSKREHQFVSPVQAEHQQLKQNSSDLIIYRIDIEWLQTNQICKIERRKQLPTITHYYQDHCPQGITGVRSYGEVEYTNLYAGINLKWYEQEGELKYDFIVDAGADYRQIRMLVKGADKIYLGSEGELHIVTPLGEITEAAPLVIQNDKRLAANWRINDQEISFEIKDSDPSLPLIIDPMVRIWGTYYGGVLTDHLTWCSTDSLGNIYAGGFTESVAGIATSGSHQSVHAGLNDVCAAKFSSSGMLLWATYYGTSNSEGSICGTVSGSGDIYIGGSVGLFSPVIATAGTHQGFFSGGFYDGFIVKFNTNGIRQWGSYYGGNGSDDIASMCLDINGNLYVAGVTTSTVNITLSALHQPSYSGGTDAFLFKMNASTGTGIWATYFGGVGNEELFDCKADSSGNIYITGGTQSSSQIASAGAHQTSFAGQDDAFLAKFNSAGIRQWATYYGSTGIDKGFSCSLQGQAFIYVGGFTTSNNGLSTAGTHQPTYTGGSEGFIVKFNNNGARQWATYYGGATDEAILDLIVEPGGDLCFAGHSSSASAIATSGSYQSSNGGNWDVFLGKLSGNGIRQWKRNNNIPVPLKNIVLIIMKKVVRKSR